MNKGSLEILDGATREELSAAIQLLAHSLVQHRQRQAFVRLDLSADEVDDDEAEGEDVVEEALEIVRARSADEALSAQSEALADEAQENRTQFRLDIAIPMKVVWPDEKRPADARLQNISWGGAAFVVEHAPAEPGQLVRLMLPRPQGGSIAVEARILRIVEAEAGLRVSVRFSSLGTRDEEKLEAVLEQLAESVDDGQRNHARLTQRLELQFDAMQELESTLQDISAGGLGITIPDALKIGQSLQTIISTTDESCSLKLRARVVRQKPIKVRNAVIYRVGLKFEHPTAELQRRTAELISRIATTRPDQASR